MSVFNLKNWTDDGYKEFARKYASSMESYYNQNKSSSQIHVEAMGYIHYNNRDPYTWWDVDQLISSPDAEWNKWASEDQGLINVLNEAKYWRDQDLHFAVKNYGIPMETAKKLIRTYVGYHPSYGGYMAQIGPYRSAGGGFGSEHVIQEAVGKFSYYVWRKKKATAENVGESIAKNIKEYQKKFNVTFTPDDFALVVRPPLPFDPERAVSKKDPTKKGRQPKRKIVEYVDSMDPSSSEAQKFFHSQPMLTDGTEITLNTRGYAKLLRDLMGPWYTKVITEVAQLQGKDPKVVANDISLSFDLLKQVYKKTYDKWNESNASGEAAATGMTPPPKFLDPSLSFTSGERYWRTLPTNDNMNNLLTLRLEILKCLQGGIFEAEDIAKVLNSATKRIEVNQKLQKRKKEPILITADEVQMVLDKINKEKEEKGMDTNECVNKAIETSESEKGGRGYDDLKTAFDMCATYFSSLVLDPATNAKMGTSNVIIFNPPADFQNFTSEDMKKFKEAKMKTEEEKEKSKATPEQIKKDIGKVMPEPEKVPVKKPEEKPEEITKIIEEPVIEDVYQEEPSPELLSNTLKNLIKIAEDLDNSNKMEESEEVHKIIRKYAKRIL